MKDTNFEAQKEIIDKFDYPGLLMRRINDIDIAMMQGRDGSLEFTNLINKLSKEIRDPIMPRINKKIEELEAKIKEIKEQTQPISWSDRHYIQIQEEQARAHNRATMQEIISIIIDRLDEPEINMLMNKKRAIEHGHERGVEG